MSYTSIINYIETVIKTVTGVVDNNVYKYEVLAADEVDYINKFRDATNSVIHGYVITRNSFSEVREAGRSNLRTTTWTIRGYHSLSTAGATENTIFQPLVDSIVEAFEADPKLGNEVLSVESINLITFEPRMYGDVLCHYAEIQLTTLEQENY